MDAPFFFVHGDDAAARLEGGREMDVAHFGKGVAHGVIDRAFADLAAFNMGDWYTECECDGGGSKHFVAISDQQKKIGAHLPETIGEAQGGHADGLGHSHIGVGAEKTLELGSNGKAVFFDFADGVTEFGREVRTEDDEFEIDFGMCGQIAEGPIQVAVVGAGSGDDGDFAFQGFLLSNGATRESSGCHGIAGATSRLSVPSSALLIRNRQEYAIVNGNRAGEERGCAGASDGHVAGIAAQRRTCGR